VVQKLVGRPAAAAAACRHPAECALLLSLAQVLSCLHELTATANDSLTIIGDLAGDGEINVDVSGVGSDEVVVEGSVDAGTTQVINVALVDAPDQASPRVAVLAFSGDSVAGHFTLGHVGVGPRRAAGSRDGARGPPCPYRRHDRDQHRGEAERLTPRRLPC